MGSWCTRSGHNLALKVDVGDDSPSSAEDLYNIESDGEKNVKRFSSRISAKWREYVGQASNELEAKRESKEEDSSVVDSGLAQLWEDCFDLSELMEVTAKKVLKHSEEFWIHGYEGLEMKGEDEQKSLDLLRNIADGLDTTRLDGVVNKLRVAVFSRKSLSEEKEADPVGYLNVVMQVQENIVKTANKSFDLFLLSMRIYQRTQVDYHTQRSSLIWNQVFRVYNHVYSIIERLTDLTSPIETIKKDGSERNKKDSCKSDPGLESDNGVLQTPERRSSQMIDPSYESNGCERDILIMLNSMVRFVRWKQASSPTGIENLLESVQGLRLEFTKVYE